MLDIENLDLSRGRKTVLSGFSARAKGGEIIALTGPNGAGKTTLLFYMAGLLKEDSGEMRWKGTPVHPATEEWKRNVSFVLDDGGVIPLLTVEAQLHLQCSLSGLDRCTAADRTDHVCRLFSLDRFRNYRAGELSLGTRKRLGLALGVIRDAGVYLFDEPLGSLDEEGYSVFGGILGALHSGGRICVVASHAVSYFYPLCHGVWELSGEGHRVYRDKGEFRKTHPPENREITLPWIE